ncbi:MAG: hypothetical protein MI922_30415, partial [Bacteroidales bacterium]|nr:hypothetical protein [Bacteroidales bacterium]
NDQEAPDSYDMMDVILGKTKEGREIMHEESFTHALRVGDWKYIQPVSGKIPGWMKNKDIEVGLTKEPQLYNLKDDIGEQNNLAESNPEKAAEMEKMLQKILAKGTRVK